jgi:arylsulfatase
MHERSETISRGGSTNNPFAPVIRRIVLTALTLATIVTNGALAQQPAPERCSPAGTTSVNNANQLPEPDKPFGGVIKRDSRDSTPCWDPRIVPPKGAPNVLLIMTDDAGFGVSSAFGGVIPTPALDRIANSGLRYTNFNSTALCSPTRAALITGRNHHSVGFGVISEQATGYPGYNSIIPKDKSTVGRILQENGYSTSC